MKAIRTAVVSGLLLGVAAIASAQLNMPAPGSPGSSPDSAVRLVAGSDLMVDRQVSRWLRAHYPGWDADPIEFTEIGMERYAVVYITSANNPGRRVYFRIQSRVGTDPDGGDRPIFPR